MVTPKQRMLNAYRGIANDTPAVAPEFWYYYPAKLLGVDMIEFRKIPFHIALKSTFARFSCEGWGVAWGHIPVPDVETTGTSRWISASQREDRQAIKTPYGPLSSAHILDKNDAAVCESDHYIKEFDRDLPAFEHLTLGGNPESLEVDSAIECWNDVGESYLLEFALGSTFFDYLAPALQGGLEQGIAVFTDRVPRLEKLQERYIDFMVRKARAMCLKTPYEAAFIGCTWSCISLLSPAIWRKWDKPVLKAVADELHRHGRLLHHHFHGKCLEVVADFAEIGIDCVCAFERPPSGDVAGLDGLREVASRLAGRTTMNGNINTVDTLIRGGPDDVRREVREVREAFAGNPRVIIGTGDQVGRETPEENLLAMIQEARS